MEARDLFHPESVGIPLGFHDIGVPDSALNVGSQPAKQPASQRQAVVHLTATTKVLTGRRRETAGEWSWM